MVWLSAAHQTLRMYWFGLTWRTNHSPNVTYNIVFVHMSDQTIEIQWFEGPRLTKQYAYNDLGTHGTQIFTNTMTWWSICLSNVTYTMVWSDCSQNITNTWVWKSMARQTLRIQRFADTWLTKPYKYNIFNVSECFPCFPCFPCFTFFQVSKFFQVLKGFTCFPCVIGFAGFYGFHNFHVFLFSRPVPGRARSA